MRYRKFPIVPDAFIFVLPLVVLVSLSIWWGSAGLTVLFIVITLYVMWFFRNPERTVPDDSKAVVSPADGRVLKVEEADGGDILEGSFKKISIFMNIFNVHVNRCPCSGVIKTIRYRKGKFFSANLDKASSQNERNSLVIETEEGKQIIVVQIAGLVARRIVCWAKEGEVFKRGERFGLIRFGSRLEVFMPVDTEVLVRVGDRVQAGHTKVGKLT
ncbi:MAG: phosphatidylserine decarboxylase family protein [Deltaproteobacteria bacterium]|nr:phosphatidylserine decarboxylase family protein [Deltaproteobacteria bacterium]